MEIQLWREILEPYELAVRELSLKFDHLMTEYREHGRYCPFLRVDGRVKSVSSILEKAQKKKIPFEMIEEEMEDIAGIRIICQFVEDIDKVAQIIEKRGDMQIKCVKDYLTNAKPSGYRSYHLILEIPIFLSDRKLPVRVEVQLRTVAMDFWASLEHQMKYKKELPDAEAIGAQLRECAETIASIDQRMMDIRDQITQCE